MTRGLLFLACGAVLFGQSTRIVRPKEIDSVLTNPGIGFTTLNRFNGDPLNPGTRWTEGHPIAYVFKYILFGEGETAPLVREILRSQEPDPEQRPRVHVS